MKAVTSIAFASLVLAFWPRAACAWDSPGHEQIADIAWTMLDSKTKTEIEVILKHGDPKFAPADGTGEANRDAFRLASTFPDYIKFNHDTIYESLIGPMNEHWPQQPGDPEGVRCKTWHYFDTPIRYHGQKPGVRPSNALVALPYAIQQLKNLERSPAPDRQAQAWWLYWIEHLVGDLHQPLHCVTSYEFGPDGDAGGNKFPIQDVSKRLHAYWDEGIDHAALDDHGSDESPAGIEHLTAAWLGDHALRPSKSASTDLNPADWVKAGAKLADTVVYTGINRNEAPSSTYRQAQTRLCRLQAILAGYRLAAVLNKLFGSH
jgi:hypothetical protein